VLFVAPSPLESLPLLPQTVGSESICQPDSHVLRRIHFKYPANLTELLHLLATLHIPHCQDETTPYDSIIVDDVHKFVSNQATGKGASMTAELAQLCAYIVDAAKYFNQQREKSVDLHVSHLFSISISREMTGAVSSSVSSGVALSFSTHMRNGI
jgi:hypothetical protein